MAPKERNIAMMGYRSVGKVQHLIRDFILIKHKANIATEFPENILKFIHFVHVITLSMHSLIAFHCFYFYFDANFFLFNQKLLTFCY